jgi:hypothetical protein
MVSWRRSLSERGRWISKAPPNDNRCLDNSKRRQVRRLDGQGTTKSPVEAMSASGALPTSAASAGHVRLRGNCGHLRYASFFVEAFRAAGLDYPRATISAYSNPVRNALVSKGRFLTIVPESEVRFAGKNAVLKALPIELPTMRLPVGIVTLRNRPLSATAQLFIERARELAKPLAKSNRSGSRRAQGTGSAR